MIETIKPRGAISEKLVKGIITHHHKPCIVDISGNIYEVREYDYLNLKGKVKDYDSENKNPGIN